MNKKICVGLLAALMMSVACSDDSYKGTDEFDIDKDATPIPVLISLGKTAVVETKGVGAVNGLGGVNNPFVGSKVFIYAYKKQEAGDNNNYFVESEMPPSAATDPLGEPDCLIKGQNGFGKEAIINESLSANLEWSDRSTLFYPSSKVGYDFYGYFLDDAKSGEVVCEQERIYFPVTIDGSQDLMSAKAIFTDPDSDNPYKDDYLEIWNNLSDDEKVNAKKLAFSSYTARRQIQPILHFKHHLVRLNFEVFGGCPDSTVEITRLYLDKCPSVAKFTVAAKDPQQMGVEFMKDTELVAFDLKDSISVPDGKKWEDISHNLPSKLTPFEIPKQFGSSQNPYDHSLGKIGAGLLVSQPLAEPGTEDYAYKCVIEMRQIHSLSNGKPVYKKFTTNTFLRLKGNGEEPVEFLPGHQYTIRIAVYGLKTVGVTVLPEGWIDGGSIDVDEDDLIGK